MPVREILIYPENEAALRRKSDPVNTADREVRKLIRDLKHTLGRHPHGVGLAAPQIGVHRRIVVVRLGAREASQDTLGQIVALINPVILEAANEKPDFDGCLSFPGLYGETIRPHNLIIAGLDENGEPFNRHFRDFDAVLVHHEIDHLEGVLFIDRISRLDDLYRISQDKMGRPIRIPISATPSRKESLIIGKTINELTDTRSAEPFGIRAHSLLDSHKLERMDRRKHK